MRRTTATCSPSSLKSSGAVVRRPNGPMCACRRAGERMSKHLHLPHLSLLVGFCMMTAAAGAGQVKTATPAESVERHLSNDQKPREWSLQSDGTDDTKRIKVCRVEDVCKMRFKDGFTPRTR